MPAAPDPITSPPNTDFQPYDSADDAEVSGWAKLHESGPVDVSTMEAHGDFEDGPGPWRQT